MDLMDVMDLVGGEFFGLVHSTALRALLRDAVEAFCEAAFALEVGSKRS